MAAGKAATARGPCAVMLTMLTAGRPLESLKITNRYTRLPDAFYQRVLPTPLPEPYLVAANPDAAALIDLAPGEAARAEFVRAFSGNELLPGSEPFAAIYAGHQFGHFVPQLGDGRAISLGEVASADGTSWELNLKGSGLTAFSRDGDGRAVLRSTIREYLCSEAMHALGVPTTRALCITGSDEPVYRETVETAAVLLRLAPSFVRIGTFELFYSRKQYDHVRTLADYVIERWYPQFAADQDRYARLLAAVCECTAATMAHWQAVGFTHGVMNTDNMSILGLTIDYGPYGFIDGYVPDFVCNHTDHAGRYALSRQPSVAFWNLRCLAQCLTALISEDEAVAALQKYEPALQAAYREIMRRKLGFHEWRDEDGLLLRDLFAVMAAEQTDYTHFFRALADAPAKADAYAGWFARYRERVNSQPIAAAQRRAVMQAANPKYILRNYLAQRAIERAQQRDYSEIERLWRVLRRPFDEQPEMEAYAAPPPQSERGFELSCSS